MTVTNLFGDLALDSSVQEINTTLEARLPTDTGRLLTTSEIDLAVTPNLAAVGDEAINVQAAKSKKFTWSFAKVKSGIDTDFASIIKTGSGMAINQTGGNLVVTTGTTAYSESIIRSVSPFSGLGIMRYAMMLSQRIANQNFIVEWTDIIGDGLSYTINSATSVTVTKVAHGFTSENVGQGMWIGALTTASTLTQRGVIASVTTDTITFTVAGFPASGTGTCSLFGYNFHQVAYSGTTATTLGTGYATQRKGWQNAYTNATINTTASPGHIGILETSRSFDASYLDQIPGTGTGIQATQRATSNWNVPDEDTELYLQIRVFNGTTAPATTTTMTIGFIHGEMYNPLMVNVSGVQSFAGKNALPVTGTVAISNPTSSQPNLAPSATYGHSTYHHLISAATSNATSVKASAGTIGSVTLTNNSANYRYFKLYNKASAPTVGTDTPIHTIGIPPNSAEAYLLGSAYGLRCSTGIAYAITGGIAVADTTAVAANEIAVSINYT